MIFSYNWLQSFFKKRLPKPEKLAELLTFHFFEVSEVKRVGSDWIFQVDILPNRASDCFSHLGIAREIAAILNFKFQAPISKFSENKKLGTKDFVSVEIKGKGICSRYTARVVTEVRVGLSPKWIKERLKVCGLKSINNIVDILNYVMLETGQPLHAFDLEKLEGPNSKFKTKKLIVRFAKKQEKIVTLDGEKYDLDDDILVIADSKKPIAIAGLKGGKIPEIDKKTKIVVLESANFNRLIIRRASQKLNLKTDASLRFEHSLDPNLTEIAINRAVSLIEKIASGKVTKDLVDFYPKKVISKKIKLDLNYVEKLLGIKISEKKIKSILRKLGMKITEISPRLLEVTVPTFRLDISLPEDLIEEIGRIGGYQEIPAVFPRASLILPKRNLEIFWEDMAKNILKEAGFTEVYNYSFISEKFAQIFGYSGQLIALENPISLEQKYLRPSLIPNLLKNVKENLKHLELIKIFELAKAFKKIKKQKSKIIEKRQLSGLITGEAFYQLKGVTDLLLKKLGISNIWYDSYQPTPEDSKISIWHPKKSAEIKVNGQEIGFLGEISPKILEKLKIKSKVVVFDFDFEKLQKLCSEEHEYQPVSSYPAAVRDIAVLVPREVKVVEVLNKINAVADKLVRDIDLFDIYEGRELPQGKKNLAFHIIYQAEDRTLSSKEIDKIQEKIIKTLEEDPEWQVRK